MTASRRLVASGFSEPNPIGWAFSATMVVPGRHDDWLTLPSSLKTDGQAGCHTPTITEGGRQSP